MKDPGLFRPVFYEHDYLQTALARREEKIVDPLFLEGVRQLKPFWAKIRVCNAE